MIDDDDGPAMELPAGPGGGQSPRLRVGAFLNSEAFRPFLSDAEEEDDDSPRSPGGGGQYPEQASKKPRVFTDRNANCDSEAQPEQPDAEADADKAAPGGAATFVKKQADASVAFVKRQADAAKEKVASWQLNGNATLKDGVFVKGDDSGQVAVLPSTNGGDSCKEEAAAMIPALANGCGKDDYKTDESPLETEEEREEVVDPQPANFAAAAPPIKKVTWNLGQMLQPRLLRGVSGTLIRQSKSRFYIAFVDHETAADNEVYASFGRWDWKMTKPPPQQQKQDPADLDNGEVATAAEKSEVAAAAKSEVGMAPMEVAGETRPASLLYRRVTFDAYQLACPIFCDSIVYGWSALSVEVEEEEEEGEEEEGMMPIIKGDPFEDTSSDNGSLGTVYIKLTYVKRFAEFFGVPPHHAQHHQLVADLLQTPCRYRQQRSSSWQPVVGRIYGFYYRTPVSSSGSLSESPPIGLWTRVVVRKLKSDDDDDDSKVRVDFYDIGFEDRTVDVKALKELPLHLMTIPNFVRRYNLIGCKVTSIDDPLSKREGCWLQRLANLNEDGHLSGDGFKLDDRILVDIVAGPHYHLSMAAIDFEVATLDNEFDKAEYADCLFGSVLSDPANVQEWQEDEEVLGELQELFARDDCKRTEEEDELFGERDPCLNCLGWGLPFNGESH